MKRVLALGGAALFIVIAVLVRGALDDDGDGVTTDDSDDDEPTELVVACIPELEDACDQLDGVATLRIEDPQRTIDNPDDIDAWITLDPWPEIAAEQIDGSLLEAGTAVAQTGLSLVLFEAAADACPDHTWTCVVDAFGDDVAIRPPDTALGLLSYGNAAADWFQTTTGSSSFARNDFTAAGFREWITSVATDDDPVRTLLQFRGAQFKAAGSSSVDVTTQLGTAADRDSYVTSPGAVPATVVAVVTGPSADELREALQDALRDLGWEPAEPDARSVGMPSAGVLFALAQEVS